MARHSLTGGILLYTWSSMQVLRMVEVKKVGDDDFGRAYVRQGRAAHCSTPRPRNRHPLLSLNMQPTQPLSSPYTHHKQPLNPKSSIP